MGEIIKIVNLYCAGTATATAMFSDCSFRFAAQPLLAVAKAPGPVFLP
jgi:hypothetical protein